MGSESFEGQGNFSGTFSKGSTEILKDLSGTAADGEESHC